MPQARCASALALAIVLAVAVLLAAASARAADGPERHRERLQPLPALAPVPADNPQSAAKVTLGQWLFWDRRVSRTGATNCALCHHPSFQGAEPLARSVGIVGDTHLRNSPTVLNAAHMDRLFWSAEQPSLEAAALAAVRSPVAMRSVPAEVAERLNRVPEYRALAVQAFGAPLDEQRLGQALAAYMRELVTPDYPLARWLRGDDAALTPRQLRGLASFVDRGCTTCHAGPRFSNGALVRVSLPGADADLGRARSTRNDEDRFLFKVPSLLNVARTPPYGHDGSVARLDEMVRLMGRQMLQLELPDAEVDDIAAFLEALSGRPPAIFGQVPALPVEPAAGAKAR